jgi:hypothetical protein
MKPYLFLIAFLISISSIENNVYCQSTSAGFGNTPSTGFPNLDFLGWTLGTQAGGALTTGGTSIIPDLTIKTDDPMPISFLPQQVVGSTIYVCG